MLWGNQSEERFPFALATSTFWSCNLNVHEMLFLALMKVTFVKPIWWENVTTKFTHNLLLHFTACRGEVADAKGSSQM